MIFRVIKELLQFPLQIKLQFERKKSHDHERKRKYNLLGDRMAYVN